MSKTRKGDPAVAVLSYISPKTFSGSAAFRPLITATAFHLIGCLGLVSTTSNPKRRVVAQILGREDLDPCGGANKIKFPQFKAASPPSRRVLGMSTV